MRCELGPVASQGLEAELLTSWLGRRWYPAHKWIIGDRPSKMMRNIPSELPFLTSPCPPPSLMLLILVGHQGHNSPAFPLVQCSLPQGWQEALSSQKQYNSAVFWAPAQDWNHSSLFCCIGVVAHSIIGTLLTVWRKCFSQIHYFGFPFLTEKHSLPKIDKNFRAFLHL